MMLRQKPIVSFAVVGTVLAMAVAIAASGTAAPRPAPSGAAAAGPVVIELFHSQGCSSCPPAEADLNALATRDDVLALSFGVTYWDRLGWKDTFASERFTARQIDYARAGRGEVATPEFIVNGAYAVVGADRPALDAAIRRARGPGFGPAITGGPAAVHIAAGAGAPATVWLVRYDPRTLQVPIGAGENSGRTLPQRNVVRELVDLGCWTGPATTLPLPPARQPGLVSAVFVQRGNGGPIVAVRKF